MTTQTDLSQLSAVASRLREMREIMGWTAEEMAEKTEVPASSTVRYVLRDLSTVMPPTPRH